MTCLVVVVGESDEGFVYGLAKVLGVKVKVLKMRSNRPNKAIRLVRAELVNRSYSKVVVLKDQHRSREDAVLKKLQEIEARIRHPRIYTIMVRRAVEAWILAGMNVSNAESIDEPDAYLDIMLRREGKGSYVKSFWKAKQLAKETGSKQHKTIHSHQVDSLTRSKIHSNRTRCNKRRHVPYLDLYVTILRAKFMVFPSSSMTPPSILGLSHLIDTSLLGILLRHGV